MRFAWYFYITQWLRRLRRSSARALASATELKAPPESSIIPARGPAAPRRLNVAIELLKSSVESSIDITTSGLPMGTRVLQRATTCTLRSCAPASAAAGQAA
jgi:hypothetical protein